MAESFKIDSAHARLVFDSRGDATIEVELQSGKVAARVAAPAGKSRGKREVEYYPNNNAAEAVRVFNSVVSSRLVGRDPADQRGVDELLTEIDGTGRFERIGGNAAYATSVASAVLAARLMEKQPYEHIASLSGQTPQIPMPLGNVLGGGSHAGEGAPDIQEILVFPASVDEPLKAVKAVVTVHKALGSLLTKRVPGFTKGRGDEGAYSPNMTNEEALAAVKETVENVSDELAVQLRMGIDMAASSLYSESAKQYNHKRSGKTLDRRGQIEYVGKLIDEYGLRYVEDPLQEDDIQGFAELRKSYGETTLICGDDLLVTRAELVREAGKASAVNAMIIKPNQVGTLTATMDAVREAARYGIAKIVSHRSGEACDGVLAHIAVGLGANLIKAGIMGGERIAKANELLRIWESSRGRLGLSRLA
ncbi:MAG: enolase [Aigarchaeota archaeon]|nr:enolase [Candidatus Pelearchaeum maunauluense]